LDADRSTSACPKESGLTAQSVKRKKRVGDPASDLVFARRPLTAAEAAEYLGVTEKWVRKHSQEGVLPFVRVGKRLVRFLPDDLDEWMREHRNLPAGRS
jgi:excisionase family DNA binding protein